MNGTAPTFRGYHAIGDVVERMRPLAEWMRTHRPDCAVLTLRRTEIDLLQRWPKAAELHGIVTNRGVSYFQGFTLRADHSAPRYERTLPYAKQLGVP